MRVRFLYRLHKNNFSKRTGGNIENGLCKGHSKRGYGWQILSIIGMITTEQQINQAIADADPLDVDSSLRMLPILNEQKNSGNHRRISCDRLITRAQDQSKERFYSFQCGY